MKTTFEHFKSIFQGNHTLYYLIGFLNKNYVMDNKSITNNCLRDGHDICFLTFSFFELQKIFDDFDYESLHQLGDLNPDLCIDGVPMRINFCLEVLEKFEEAGVLNEFLLTEK